MPSMLDHVNAGRLSLARFVDLTSAGPARLYNIACKGRIAAGYDADFTIVDLKRTETITNKWVASRAGAGAEVWQAADRRLCGGRRDGSGAVELGPDNPIAQERMRHFAASQARNEKLQPLIDER